MKTRTIIMTAMLFLGLSYTVNAKDLKGDKKSEVTFLVSMTCENCQKRIENKMSFEKGVTNLDVNLPQKTVTIKYRKDKTSPDKLKDAIRQLGYTVTPLDKTKTEKKDPSPKKDKEKSCPENTAYTGTYNKGNRKT